MGASEGQNDAASNYGSFGNQSHTSQLPQVTIDEKVVQLQKEKALKELSSRVELASSQHKVMYQVQRSHIVSEHERQFQVAKAAIEDEKASALMALEQAYSQNLRAIDQSASSQKLSIEQQANDMEIKSIQHQMAMQHAERERQWASSYSQPTVVYQQPGQFFPQFPAFKEFASTN